MRSIRRSLWLGASVLGVLGWSAGLMAQAVPDKGLAEKTLPDEAQALAAGEPKGIPTDWSHHSLIFSRPGTAEQAKRVQQDPRYWLQQYRRGSATSRTQGFDVTPQSGVESSKRQQSTHGRIKKDWSQDMGPSATAGAGNYPAKFEFTGQVANCATAAQPDFVVYGTGVAGSLTQASLMAFDNLYSGCTGTVPQVYWAYNTGGTVMTSPVFSLDGTQVAFVETNGGFGILVLLKWAPSAIETFNSPATPTTVSPLFYGACTAPCMTQVQLEDSSFTHTDDTTSSIFVDYSNNIGWVGGAFGWLHKIKSLFSRPREVFNGIFPVQVNNSSLWLGSPVLDFASGVVFVGDSDGFLYSVDGTTGAVTQSGQLDFGVGIVDSPMVDSTADLVYVFASSDGSGSCPGGADCAAVYELNTNFGPEDPGTGEVVGTSTISGTNPNPLYDGAFDSAYINSESATGNLYVCGNTGGVPMLYRVAIKNGTFNARNIGPPLSGSNTPCSPLTDLLNPNATAGPTEWIFAGTEANGVPSGCASGGCVMNFKNTAWLPATAYSVGQEILDSNLNIQVVITAGTSAGTAPVWNSAVDKTTTDGGVTWLCQGTLSTTTPVAWVRNHAYAKRNLILDPVNNYEFVTTAGNSGGTIPTFSAIAGHTTIDGSVTWTNLGANAVAALPAAGGTSGIIIDNTVVSGGLAGTSQIYFSTLTNQACTGGTGGCAVQASQSALK